MKLMNGFLIFVVLIALLGSSVGIMSANAHTLHALLIIDDGVLIEEANKSSGTKMEKLLRGIQSETDLSIHISRLNTDFVDPESPEVASAENILKWIKNVQIGRNDVVLVYFVGHGGAEKYTRDLFCLLLNERFFRNRLVSAISGLECRLKILITDTDSYDGMPVNEPMHTSNPSDSTRVNDTHVSLDANVGYNHLFLQHEGFLNLTAATEGEFSCSRVTIGSFFTHAFVAAVSTCPDSDGDGFVSWQEVFTLTRQKTMALFEEIKSDLTKSTKEEMEAIGQKSQRPKYYGELPKRIMR